MFDLLHKVLDKGSGFLLYISPAIKQELLAKLKEKFDFEQVDNFMVVLDRRAYNVSPTEKIDFLQIDPDDNKILECAVAAEADLIVTMDKHLLKLKTFRKIGIVHPKAFSYMFPKE